jgi:hypothetical protein
MKTKASAFDKKFDDGESVITDLDLSKARRPIVNLGGGKILLPTNVSRLGKIAARAKKRLQEENFTLDDILGQLDEERKKYNKEL